MVLAVWSIDTYICETRGVVYPKKLSLRASKSPELQVSTGTMEKLPVVLTSGSIFESKARMDWARTVEGARHRRARSAGTMLRARAVGLRIMAVYHGRDGVSGRSVCTRPSPSGRRHGSSSPPLPKSHGRGTVAAGPHGPSGNLIG